MRPMLNSDGIDRQTGLHSLWRVLAEVAASLAAGGAFVFLFTHLVIHLLTTL